MYNLGGASKKNLIGVDSDLRSVIHLALLYCDCDFSVVEGLRTEKRQSELVAAGKSKTEHSRHLTGHAVDILPWVNGKSEPDSLKHYRQIAKAMFRAAIELGVDIEWGGHWSDFVDCPHWQLSRNSY